MINRFISPNQQRSISICVGNSDLGVATVGDAEVNNIPTDATFFELLPDGFQAALFARAAHFIFSVNYSTIFGLHSRSSSSVVDARPGTDLRGTCVRA